MCLPDLDYEDLHDFVLLQMLYSLTIHTDIQWIVLDACYSLPVYPLHSKKSIDIYLWMQEINYGSLNIFTVEIEHRYKQISPRG